MCRFCSTYPDAAVRTFGKLKYLILVHLLSALVFAFLFPLVTCLGLRSPLLILSRRLLPGVIHLSLLAQPSDRPGGTAAG